MKKYQIAVLDDYQNAALESAAWSLFCNGADSAVFQHYLSDSYAVTERVLPFYAFCVRL